MSTTDEQGKVRKFLTERLRLDLLGPNNPDEVLRQDRETREGDTPLSKYLVGILYPSGSLISPDEDDSANDGGGGRGVDAGQHGGDYRRDGDCTAFGSECRFGLGDDFGGFASWLASDYGELCGGLAGIRLGGAKRRGVANRSGDSRAGGADGRESSGCCGGFGGGCCG